MVPQLQVLAGTDPDHLVPITNLVNTGKTYHIQSDAFEGDVLVYLKDFGMNDDISEPYFLSSERAGVTWSIQAQGRFLRSYTADDILFGNTFDDPISLPWGSGAVLALMKRKDPAIEHDLSASARPWALSPLFATASHLAVSKGETPAFPPLPSGVLKEDTSGMVIEGGGEDDDREAYDTAAKRRAYFRDAENRKKVVLDDQVTITFDFCHGHLSFTPTLALNLMGGVQKNLARLWDGRQVRFVCCERRPPPLKEGEDVWGRIFWCVAFEPAEKEGEEAEGEARGQASEQVDTTTSDDVD
jgi:hypothetical protein